MLKNSGLVSPERTFLQDCFSVPVVRDKLRRGVKIQDLGDLKRFLEMNRESQLVKKEYGYLVQDLEFLEMSGALKTPSSKIHHYLTVQPHWVAIKGYFSVDAYNLSNESLQCRFIINTPSVYAPILILNNDSWNIYKRLSEFFNNRAVILSYLLYILEAVCVIDESPEYLVSDSYITYLSNHYSNCDIFDRSLSSYTSLVEYRRVEDTYKHIPRIIDGSYCLPTNSWITSNGAYYLMALPSWTLSGRNSEDYTKNHIDEWEFFAATA